MPENRVKQGRLSRTLLSDVIRYGVPEPEELEPDVLIKGASHQIFTWPEQGKTWLALWLITNAIRRGQPAVFLDAENGRRIVSNFTADVRRRLGLASSYLLILNAKNTSGSILAGFDRGWLNLDPSVSALLTFEDVPRCLETNLQIRQELDGEDFEEIGHGTWESPPTQMRDLSEELSSAFGLQDPVLLPRDESR